MSIKKNFLYNTAITISSYIVAFLVFPYISRVLGVSNIGIVGYVDNIIDCFILFACLGVSTVGIREIAAISGDVEKTSKVFSQIFSLLIVTVCISLILYIGCILFIPALRQYRVFLGIGLCKLLFTPLLIEWLFAGNQDFKYISIRTISIKILYVLSIFLFVKDQEDTIIYFILTSISIILNFFVNIISSRKYLDIKYFSFEPKTYFKPVLKLGIFAIITSLYSTFNYVYLGTVSTTTQVGFYYTAIKLYDVIIRIFRSYTSVVLPNMAKFVSSNDIDNFNSLLNKSYEALFSYSIPLTFVTSLIAPFIVFVIAGPGYEESAISMRIIMPILIIAGINQINGIQVLMPLKKDNVLMVTGSIAALVGVCSNILLDSKYGAIGASITILLSEITGCIGGIGYTSYKKIVRFPYSQFLKYSLTSIPYLIIYLGVSLFGISFYIRYILIIILSICYFMIQQLFICKNSIIINMINMIKGKIKNMNILL